MNPDKQEAAYPVGLAATQVAAPTPHYEQVPLAYKTKLGLVLVKQVVETGFPVDEVPVVMATQVEADK